MTTPFLETPRFPDDMAVWALGGVGFNTTVVGSTSGRETRNSIWTYGRGQWDLQNTFRTQAGVVDPYSVQTLRNFFRVCKGQAYGFRFKDWTDYLDEGMGLLGQPIANYSITTPPSGAGNGSPVLQMFKAYLAAPLFDYRLIAKPRAVQIYRNGTLVPPGVGAGNANVDLTTGLVTFVPDTKAVPTSYVPGTTTGVVVPAIPAGWTAGTVVSFQNVGGTGAALLNNLPFQILTIVGTTLTVNANTTGLTLSPAGGTSVVGTYTQVTDSLTWTGTFDTPVRFGTDQFAPQLDTGSGALYGFQTLQIVEIRV